MKKVIIAALVSGALLTQPAFAKLQTFSFSGEVQRMEMSYYDFTDWGTYEKVYRSVQNAGSWGGAGISVGQRFDGTVSFDDDPARASTGASLSFVFQGGGPEASFSPGVARAGISDRSYDGVVRPYLAAGGYAEESNLLELSMWTFLRLNANGRYEFDPLFGGGASGMWRSPENISGSSDRTSFSATINSVTNLSPVPEPATYGMLLAGLGLLGVAARRNGKQPRQAAL